MSNGATRLPTSQAQNVSSENNEKSKIKFALCVVFIGMTVAIFLAFILIGRYDVQTQATASEVFSDIYKNLKWDTTGKHPSGQGSIPQRNIDYLLLVQRLVDHPKIHKIVEVGFGDFQLMRYIKFNQDKLYIGFDVVPSLLNRNTTNQKFRVVQDIHYMNETGDLLITKDVIMHWPNKQIAYFLQNVVPRFKYALLTHCMTNKTRQDIAMGGYADLNLDNFAPKQLLFSFPNNCQRSFITPHYPQ